MICFKGQGGAGTIPRGGGGIPGSPYIPGYGCERVFQNFA